MKKLLLLPLALLSLVIISCDSNNKADATTIEWQTAPTIPDSVGLSASFAGVDQDGSIVVAGGCNFPDKSLVESGTKVFSDKIYTLAQIGRAHV